MTNERLRELWDEYEAALARDDGPAADRAYRKYEMAVTEFTRQRK